MQEICCPEVTLLNHTKIRYHMVFGVHSEQSLGIEGKEAGNVNVCIKLRPHVLKTPTYL